MIVLIHSSWSRIGAVYVLQKAQHTCFVVTEDGGKEVCESRFVQRD